MTIPLALETIYYSPDVCAHVNHPRIPLIPQAANVAGPSGNK
jgi:hypothetical protein